MNNKTDEVVIAVPTEECLTELRRGLRTFKAFEHAERVIVRLAGLEQNERELIDRLTALRASCADADAALAKAQDAAHEASQAGLDRAREAVEAGRAEATQIVAEANAAVLAARGEAEAALSVVNAERDALAADRDILLVVIQERSDDLTEINEKLAAARSQRDALLKA